MINSSLWYARYCFDKIPVDLAVGLLIIFFVGTIMLLAFQGGKKGFRCSAGLLLLEYLFLLFFLSVLTRQPQAARVFNSIPFWSYRAVMEGKADLLIQNIANVLAFVPIGILLGCARGRVKWWKALLFGLVFSVLIEFFQLVLKRGFTEFDDVFHNVLGCMIGYGVYAGVAWVVGHFKP